MLHPPYVYFDRFRTSLAMTYSGEGSNVETMLSSAIIPKAVDGISFPALLLIAITLSADCFCVALGGSVSMSTISHIQIVRTAFAFGLFQALMPVLGWLAGQTVVGIIADYDHWAAFTLLALVGGRMVWESFRSTDGRADRTDITRGFLLLVLSVSTSIDALAVGLTFALIETNITVASLTIGIVAFVDTIIGFQLGKRVGTLFGRRAKLVGGVVLIGIGLRILLTHIF